MEKIGIGVTGDKNWFDRLNKVRPPYCRLINCDVHNTIANDKNYLISELYADGCESIFIFDHDCFPIKDGWADFFINAHKKTGIEHFVLCKPNHNELIQKTPIVSLYQTGTGCMMFLTRKVIEKVGYINSEYGKYGYEHAGYSWRIHQAGLTPSWYVSVNGWEKFIYSWDLDKEGAEQHNFVRSHWKGEEYKEDFILQNQDVFFKEISSPKIYYPYHLEMSNQS